MSANGPTPGAKVFDVLSEEKANVTKKQSIIKRVLGSPPNPVHYRVLKTLDVDEYDRNAETKPIKVSGEDSNHM